MRGANLRFEFDRSIREEKQHAERLAVLWKWKRLAPSAAPAEYVYGAYRLPARKAWCLHREFTTLENQGIKA